MSGAPVQVVVLTGLPGAGRTTLLDHLLDDLPPSACPAVIVHRFCPTLGISDEPTVGGVALGSKERLRETGCYAEVSDFGSGAACCLPDGALAVELRALTEGAMGVTHLFVETTGMADPKHFVQLFGNPELAATFSLRAIVCLVSTRNLDAIQPSQPMHSRGLAQICAADIVLLTRDVKEADANDVLLRSFIRVHCPSAALHDQVLSRGSKGIGYEGFGWADFDSALPAKGAGAGQFDSSTTLQVLSTEELAQKFDRMLASTGLGPLPSMTAPRRSPAIRKATALSANTSSDGPLQRAPGAMSLKSKAPPVPAKVEAGLSAPPNDDHDVEHKAAQQKRDSQSLKSKAPPVPAKKKVNRGGPRTPQPEPEPEGEPVATTEVEQDATAPPKHDHDEEHKAAQQEWEGKLLPPPPVVALWIAGNQDHHDEDIMRLQGAKAVQWLVQALLAAWCSDKLKKEGRRLLAVRAFTANLRYMHLWDVSTMEMEDTPKLMVPIKAELQKLGHILEDNYNADRLKARLGDLDPLPLHPLIRDEGEGSARQGLCVPNPPPGWHGQPAHRCEFAYLHMLLMLASAVDESFKTWCKNTLGDEISELQMPPIKSYGRMRNKMFSADDHRFQPSPRNDEKRARPEWNVDINRVLAVARSPESMIKAAEALSAAANGVAKQKNGFKLEKKQAAMQYHLRLQMLSVLFCMPGADGETMTYGELCRLPHVRKMWDEYAQKPPQAHEAGCEWDADIAAARAFLESDQIAQTKVQIIAEIQMVLPLTCEVRHKMHELYKVARADTDKQLHLDFVAIADKEARKKLEQYDTATPLRCACVRGDGEEVSHRAMLLNIADDGQTYNDALDAAFIVACRHGQLALVQMPMFEESHSRVGWQAADEVIDKCERPHLEILEALIKKPGWKWANENHHIHRNHTLMHTACRKGHTDVVELLMKYGADINAQRDSDGCTPLYIAAQYGHTSIVDLLLEASADHDRHHAQTNATPLYAAAESGHLWVVESLIKAKADIKKESHDRPPHLIAANNGHRDIVQVLIALLHEEWAEKIATVPHPKDSHHKPPTRTGSGAGKTQIDELTHAVMHDLAAQLQDVFTKSGLTIAALFHTFDKDGNGIIQKTEFHRMLKSVGVDIEMRVIDDLYSLLDTSCSGEGEIDMYEFEDWFKLENSQMASSSNANHSSRRSTILVHLQQGKES